MNEEHKINSIYHFTEKEKNVIYVLGEVIWDVGFFGVVDMIGIHFKNNYNLCSGGGWEKIQRAPIRGWDFSIVDEDLKINIGNQNDIFWYSKNPPLSYICECND